MLTSLFGEVNNDPMVLHSMAEGLLDFLEAGSSNDDLNVKLARAGNGEVRMNRALVGREEIKQYS
jgi:hypothetical protein